MNHFAYNSLLAKFMCHTAFIRLVVMVAFFLTACGKKTHHETSHPDPQGQFFNMERQAPNIAPNRCRLIGTVAAIDSTYKPVNPDDSCAKAPCRATVRVESVLGYGPAFPQPLANGQLIPVTFAFTLSPTQNLLPNMTSSYPGLGVGAKFFGRCRSECRT